MSPKRGTNSDQLRRRPPGGGTMVEPVLATARYYQGNLRVGELATGGGIDDRLRLSPWWIPHDVAVDRIGVEVTTGQATGSTRLGIYESGSDGLPDKLLIDAGTIDSSTTGFKEITIDVKLVGQHLYWTGFVHNVDSIDYRRPSVQDQPSMGRTAGGDTNPVGGMTMNHTFAALPDPVTSLTFGGGNQEIRLRIV